MTTSCSAHIKTITSGVEVFNGWCSQIQFSIVLLNLLAQSPLTTRFLFNWALTRNCSDSKYINVKPIVFARDQSNSLGMNVLPYSLVFTRRSYQLKLKERFYRRGRYLKVKYNMSMHQTRMLKLYSNVVDLIRKPAVTIMDIWMKIIENNWYYFEKELFVNNNENIIIPNVLYTFYSKNWTRPILSLN